VKLNSFAIALAGMSMTFAVSAAETPVLDIDRLFAAPDLDGPSPATLRISPDSSRITFLRGKRDDPLQQDLWEYHVGDRQVRLLVDSEAIAGGAEQLSEAEQARRERLRLVGRRGIVDYEFSPDGGALLFPLNGDLYLYEIDTGSTRQLTDTDAGETDPSFSPLGRFVSFVRERDLYVHDLETGRETRLTKGASDVISNGVAEFIAQEEMDRYTGYWWAPDDTAIAFVRVDESPVDIVQRFEIHAEDVRVYDQRYPATGTPNARVELGVVSIGERDIRWIDLGAGKDFYLARVDWFPDGRHLAVQRQARDQKTLDLLKADTATGRSRVLLSETSETWLNLHNELHILESGAGFIWLSERTGHAHLYLHDSNGELVHPLTSGAWDVVDGARARSALLHVDEAQGKLYFTATLDSPRERNVYVAPLDGSGAPQRVSRESGWHVAGFAADGSFYVDRFDNADTPPQVSVRTPDGSLAGWIERNPLDRDHPVFPYLDSMPETTFGTLEAVDGQALHYRIRKPAGFDPDSRYPVIVVVYGGPQGQRVTNRWSVDFETVMTSHGFIVFSIDNRGTGFRGVDFDAPIHLRLGHVEVIDQMTGVSWLRSQDYVDAERIGVYGWSYGGYMALMCITRERDAFAAAVSGAPVTDWALYDTHYTERYLGTPQDNPAGYQSSSVFPYVADLDDPLLVVHGMADDNVLFSHSTKLFKALQDEGIAFDVMTYPGSKHGLTRVPSTGTHAYRQVLRFFRRHLSQ